jgi:thiamine biosynthesis lipoprotein
MSGAAPPAPLVEKRFRAMGTEIRVLLPPAAVEAYAPVVETMTAWEAQFSRFRPESELSALNRAAGKPFVVSQLLFTVAETAIAAAKATGGLFDPLLATRMAELGYDRTFDTLPAAREQGRIAMWTPGRWREIILDPQRRTIQLPASSGMDLGGLAKGMAVDAAMARVIGAGVPYAAVNAGGDLAVHGLPPGFAAWPIGVGAHDLVVSLPAGALATSSVMSRRWRTGGEERHHLIDPWTGFPSASDVVLASVAAASCAQAEVAAKAALLAGRAAGAAFIERERLAGVLVGEDGSTLRLGRWSPVDSAPR